MKKLKNLFIVILMSVLCLAVYYIVIDNNDSGKGKKNNVQEETDHSKKDTVIENQEKITVSLVALGDSIIHDSIIESGKKQDGSSGYDFLFEGLGKYIEDADIATIYQTSIISGNDRGVGGYPSFNAPEEIITAVDRAGIDVALLANNWINNFSTEAIKRSISLWREKSDVMILGVNDSKEESVNIPIFNVKGKNIALLNYTYGLNMPITNKDEQYMVNGLGALNTQTGNISQTSLSESVISDIKRAEEQADFVVVFPYWGTEYDHSASETQKKWAREMTEAGADLIIGAHSRYLGDVEKITSENGNQSLCFYSIGTFCSTFNDPAALVGGMAKVDIVFDGKEAYIDEENSGILPIVTHYTYDNPNDREIADFDTVYSIDDYTNDMALAHGVIKRGGAEFSLDIINKIIKENLNGNFDLTGRINK